MNMHVLTDWNVSVWSNGELFYNALRVDFRPPEMSLHLSRGRLMRPVGGSDLNSMILRLIRSDRFDVCCDLAILQLRRKRARTQANHA